MATACFVGRAVCRLKCKTVCHSPRVLQLTRLVQTANLFMDRVPLYRKQNLELLFRSRTTEPALSFAENTQYKPNCRLTSSQACNYPFKDLELVLVSNRATAIANQALSLGSAKLQDAFYNGNIRLNGKRLIKKRAKVSLGDTIDVILELHDDEIILQRVLILSDGEHTSKGKHRYRVRCWRRLVVPRLQG